MNLKDNSLLIHNAKLISQDRIIENSWVLIADGKISKIGKGEKLPVFTGEKINAKNDFLAPGFIDLHIHGDIDKVSLDQAKSGTTSFLLSLHADNNIQSICNKIEKSKKLKLKGARCLGYHLEGPFLSKEMSGAQPKSKIIQPNKKWLIELLKKSGKSVKMMTLSGEGKVSLDLIKILKKNKILPALGHSDISYEQAEKAIFSGVVYGTHIFNRMGYITSRLPGLITSLLLNNKVFTEVIADTKHVSVALLKLLIRCKAKEKIILATDSITAFESPGIKLKNGVFWLKNGTMAGSNISLIGAVKNIVTHCNTSICDAVAMASLNPAKAIGISRKTGSISIGKDADLVIFDKNFKVRLTISKGAGIFNSI